MPRHAPCFPLPSGTDLGFLAARDTTVLTNDRWRAAGPLFESREDRQGRTFSAVRPLYSVTTDTNLDYRLVESLWPVFSMKDRDDERVWRCLLAYGHDYNIGEESRYRAGLFPVFFCGRDRTGETYSAVFPLGGSIHGFLFYDHVSFFLWPLYTSTRVNDIQSQSVLWPIFSWAKGDDVSRMRVFPIYGRSEKENKWTKHFVLWPIWTDVDYHYPNEKGGGFVFFPFFGHVETSRQESWMVLPPFIRWSKGRDYREVNCPWPLFQYRSEPQKQKGKLYLWPLWGHRSDPKTDTTFALWPLVWDRTARRSDETVRSFRIVPFYHYEAHRAATNAPTPRRPPEPTDLAPPAAAAPPPPPPSPAGAEVTERYWKLWPLVSYRRVDERTRLRLLDLSPLKECGPIERNYSPLWTLYSRESAGATLDEEFLWGLYRRQTDGAAASHFSVFPLFSRDADAASGLTNRSWSVLGGLFGYEREGSQRRGRLLYWLRFPLGRAPEDAEGYRDPMTP